MSDHGGAGIAHLNNNMNNGDNRVENPRGVKEGEARKLLMEFEEGASLHISTVPVAFRVSRAEVDIASAK